MILSFFKALLVLFRESEPTLISKEGLEILSNKEKTAKLHQYIDNWKNTGEWDWSIME